MRLDASVPQESSVAQQVAAAGWWGARRHKALAHIPLGTGSGGLRY